MSIAPTIELTEEHTEIYDRQIRVWGLEGQKRLSSSLLSLHNLDCINFEIAKNCILSGINLKLQDIKSITPEDLETNIFFPLSSINSSRLEHTQQILSSMNTLVQVSTDPSLETSSILCFSGDLQSAISINSQCRSLNIPSYFIFPAGRSVLVLNDLLSTPLSETISNIPSYLSLKKPRPNIIFHSFLAYLYSSSSGISISSLQNTIVPQETLTQEASKIQSAFLTYFYPSVQIIAGLVSQDIVRCLTKCDEPFSALLFDGENSIAYTDRITNNLN